MRFLRRARTAASAAALVLLMSVFATAQAQTPGASTAPRMPDGRPDLQGIVEGNEIPYLPSALARRQENFTKRLTDDPEAKCHMVGVPRITYMPYPWKISMPLYRRRDQNARILEYECYAYVEAAKDDGR